MRTRSVRPEMSEFMDQGLSPGADFFEDSSGEDNDSEWEDDNETRNFSEVEGLGIRNSGILEDDDGEEEVRGRPRPQNDGLLRALPSFNQIPAHDSGTATADDGSSSPLERTGTGKARQLSVRRLGKVRVVHNAGSGSAGQGTPRESMMSNDSDDLPKPFPDMNAGHGEDEIGAMPSATFPGRHRRNTGESIRADSILNAHAITMRALESLPSTASFSHFHQRSLSHGHSAPLPRPASLTEQRHITLSPISIPNDDPDRPAHLPSHFIKTPYPFSARKEFPKPRTWPRQTHNGNVDYEARKGKHVLGIVASDGEFDLRSRLQRNEDAQGVVRSRSEAVGRKKGVWEGNGSRKSTGGGREGVVWLSLRSRRGGYGVRGRLESVVVPSSLTTTRSPEGKKRGRVGSKSPEKAHSKAVTVDFDDMFFANRLREGYKNLTGPWILRVLSARKLRYIQLGQVSVWSGSPSTPSAKPPPSSRFLAARGGLDTDPDARSPFTEQNLVDLYQRPQTGKARYTWVHWARRVAASNSTLSHSYSMRSSNPRPRRHRAKSLDADSQLPSGNANEYDDKDSATPSPLHPHSTSFPDTLTTIQFVHSFSAIRIISVLALMLVLCVLAPLLWIFLGESAWALPESRSRAERVGSGMLMGGLVLGIEAVLFVVWVVGSWAWL